MNYYYDIVVNWHEEEYFDFYEWNEKDCLEFIKKIPIFRVKNKTLIDFFTHKVMVSKDFLRLIADKTLIGGKNILDKLPFACLFTDNKSVIALEFNKEGISINASKLMLDDDLNVLEFAYNLREYAVDYQIVKKLQMKKELREEVEAKNLIALEIDNLYQKKDLAKLKYLYYEYQKEEEQDLDNLYHKLKLELTKPFTKDTLKLYYIIKLSYHNV